MRRTPRYEIRLAAFFADNLMNSVAHCGKLPINVERPMRHIYELSAWLVTHGCRRPDKFRLCPSSASAWAQEIESSFSVPFFRLNVGTGDRSKLLCALLLPQCGHRRQEQASLYPSSASAWAQEIGSSFSVPFFCLSVGTGDRIKLFCTLLPSQRELNSLRVWEACFVADTHAVESLRV